MKKVTKSRTRKRPAPAPAVPKNGTPRASIPAPRMAMLAPPDRPVTRAREFLGDQVRKIIVDERLTVRVQRLDMLTLLFEGWMPLPLMTSVQRLIAAHQQGQDPEVARTFLTMPDKDRQAMVEMLQRFCVKAVVEPVFVMQDDGNPDHIPVTFLTFEQLTTIWTAIRPGEVVAEPEADRFHGAPATHVDAPAPVGEDVRPAAQPVAGAVAREVTRQ